MGNENHNNTSGDRGLGTYKERDGQIHPKDSWRYQNSRTAEDHTAWNVPHLKKGTIHQVDFNLVLTLGLRIGPVITSYHSMNQKATDNNNNNNNNNSNNNNNTII